MFKSVYVFPTDAGPSPLQVPVERRPEPSRTGYPTDAARYMPFYPPYPGSGSPPPPYSAVPPQLYPAYPAAGMAGYPPPYSVPPYGYLTYPADKYGAPPEGPGYCTEGPAGGGRQQ